MARRTGHTRWANGKGIQNYRLTNIAICCVRASDGSFAIHLRPQRIMVAAAQLPASCDATGRITQARRNSGTARSLISTVPTKGMYDGKDIKVWNSDYSGSHRRSRRGYLLERFRAYRNLLLGRIHPRCGRQRPLEGPRPDASGGQRIFTPLTPLKEARLPGPILVLNTTA